jgi:hypothetical protein
MYKNNVDTKHALGIESMKYYTSHIILPGTSEYN